MPLRLRILLLIGAVNVAVLLIVVAVTLVTEPREPAWTAALEEAFQAAQAREPDLSRWRYVRFVVRLGREANAWELVRPPELGREARLAQNELERLVEAGATGVFPTRDGLTVVSDARDSRWRAFHVRFSDRLRWESLSGLRSVFLLLFAGTLLLVLATYLILDRIVLRPLGRLAEASAAVAAGRAPDPVARPGTGDEIDRLIAAFNRMAREVHEYQQHLEDRVLSALERVTAAEGRLVVAQRLAATGTLAAGIAHEINNPLGGIVNAVHRLREGDLPAEKRAEYIQLVLEGLDRIGHIVRRVLHFTPRQAEPAPLDAAEVARRAVELAGHRAQRMGVRLGMEDRGRVDGVVGDAQELQQAVLNLILNALDATAGKPGGGRVDVDVSREGSEVVIEVRDDGVGMDEETKRRCVDLFYSTKAVGEGSGLGLGIVQHIVTDHGGTLEIDSEPGRGTTIRIRLPADETNA